MASAVSASAPAAPETAATAAPGSSLSRFTEGLKGLGASVNKTLSSAASIALTKVNESAAIVLESASDAVHYGVLWEPNERVTNCRGCGVAFMAAVRPKHHCRGCAGVFCIDCVPGHDSDASMVTKAAAKLVGAAEGSSIKVCPGCLRGETPGVEVKEQVKTRLMAQNLKKAKRPNALGEARERAAAATAKGGGEASKKAPPPQQAAGPSQLSNVEKIGQKMATSIGDSLGLTEGKEDERPSASIALSRGAMYGGGKGPGQPPRRGYFELTNKSKEVVCAKVLVKGGQPLFEVPRPSYWAIPPGQCVSGLFEPAQEQLELIILYNNPSAAPSASMVFDTRDLGWAAVSMPDRISPAALVGNFTAFNVLRLNCDEKNALLKYKGNGVVESRRGDSLGRIGLLGKLQGKRHAPGEIDYDTNIAVVHIVKF